MKRSTLIGTIAAGALVVGVGVGAAIAVNLDPAPETTTAATPTETADEVGQTPGGTDGETPAPEATDVAEADAAFLAYVEQETPDFTETVLPSMTDEELIAAGHEGCELMRVGTPLEEIRLVEGEQPTDAGYYLDTSAIFNGALYNYCPELIPDLEND